MTGRRRLSERTRGFLLVSPPLAVIAVFIGLPIAFGVLYTLGYTGGFNDTISLIAQHQSTGWGIGAYRDVFGDSLFWRSVRATVLVTVVSTVLVVGLAWLIALQLRFRAGRWARLVAGVSVLPMFIPVVIGANAILSCYGSAGLFRTVLHALGWSEPPVFAYTVTGIIIGQLWTNLPFAVLMITSGVQGVPQNLLDAARDVGASRWQRFWSVLLPLNTIPTIIAMTFTVISVLGSFTLPFIVGPTAPNLLGPLMEGTYSALNRPQQAEVMSVFVFVLAAFASVPYVWANRRAARGVA
ncbi:ABC transporter permease [Flexivirga meconopsidis]|uniref:ABC transporter permease n=1 Tax=Flexivirga meconopsidis TaxID=2977121 RepID=UPI00223F54E5